MRGLAEEAALEAAIDERLMYLEAARLPQAEVSPEEEERALAALLERKPAPARPRCGEPGLRRILRRQITILKYVEFRFRPAGARERRGGARGLCESRPRRRARRSRPRRRGSAQRLERRALDERVEAWVRELRVRADVRYVGPRRPGRAARSGRAPPQSRIRSEVDEGERAPAEPDAGRRVVAPHDRQLGDPQAAPPRDVERLDVEGEAVEAAGGERGVGCGRA